MFAFGGIEIVTIAAAESENPERSIAVAVRSVVWRISVFYIGAISTMVLVLPWNDPELESGPFVAVLNKANIPGVAGFRSEEHTSELQSLIRITYAVFCLKK